ncbi:UDP-glycosyltransferase UGT5-like [Episyrphus balteatus]|uniref:UDP-glycosyltransferase UGT5-like n=1 Tax=Episyrphus balteatus TaxID=286459 RepID=UPI002484EE20|nr:UDP-glycosyltransferase UGT5-like [Episyrphus balteatus]
MKWAVITLLLVAVIACANAYKILGVFPTMARSHFFVGSALMRGLAEKGHQVTVVSPYPAKKPIKNYRDVVTPNILEVWKARADNIIKIRDQTIMQAFMGIYDMGIEITNSTLEEPSLKQLMASGEKFDAVVCEVFVSEALFGLAEHFNAPLIGLSTFGATQWNTDLVGSPSPPSYVPNPFLPLTHEMSLSGRIFNLAVTTMEHVFFNNFYLPRQRDLFKKHFPNSKKGLDNIRKDTALVLLNAHVSLGFPRPYMPNMIEVGGMHIERKQKPLPAEMKKFLDEAKDGAIFFSMGSNLKSTLLPAEKRDAILKTFKSLKQRVMWKFEDKNLPGKSDNVLISDWFPQQDILAHPNVKLFITHGGLLSTTESIFLGKPFIGVPMFGDQYLNMARAEAGGYGIMVDYNELTQETFSAAINKMLKDKKYEERAKVISERYRDQPLEPLELATYWVEYIAKHKGAPHLHSAGQELNFIQYHNLDAMIILFGGISVVLVVVLAIVYKLLAMFLAPRKKMIKKKKN